MLESHRWRCNLLCCRCSKSTRTSLWSLSRSQAQGAASREPLPGSNCGLPRGPWRSPASAAWLCYRRRSLTREAKKTGEGAGLGLSTVYGFAKQSGGHVEIDSKIGVGIEVRLYLPQANAPLHSTEGPASSSVPLGTGETLLIVEDNSQLRKLLAMTIEGR